MRAHFMVKTPEKMNRTRFLVLESQHKTPLLQELYQTAEAPSWLYLFADTEWQAYVEEGPVLLEAGQESEEYCWALKALKQGRLSGLILESPQGLNAVARWLRERLAVNIGGHRQGLLRFYDPLIWDRLEPKTNADAEVIERVIYWHGKPGQQRWMTTENPEPIAMSPVPALNEQQWSALNAISS
ncbi:DUF4123 domain-containing protein [Marinobacter alexandrii]|uniref:DUF4123 domain-containing protein n=1 Tax=Marinobacter alexandrii TaxID=2570351 RepID=UPI003266B923